MNTLSTELVVNVLSHLQYRQLVRCRQVCSRFRDIVNGTTSLQQVIELGAAAYRTADVRGRGLALDLEAFRRAQRMYRNPKVSLVETVDLREDVELNKYGWNGIWHQFGDILLGYTKGPHEALGFLALNPARPTTGNNMTLPPRFHTVTLPLDFARVFVDPSQGLLTVHSTRSIRFLSLHTGNAHERAKCSSEGKSATLSLVRDSTWPLECSLHEDWALQSYGKGGIDMNTGCDVCLYHWPSGRLVKTWQYSEPDRRVYMPGCLVGQHLVLPHRGTEPSSGIRLDVYTLPRSQPSPVTSDLTFVGSFETPPEVHAVFLQRMPLSTASAGRAIVPKQDFFRMYSATSDASVVISITALLSTIFEASLSDTSGSPPVLPWDKWGPVAARNAHGWCPVDTVGMHMLLRTGALLDFNQYDLANDVYGTAGASVPSVIHEGPAVIITSAGNRAVTGLRYRETQIALPECKDNDVLGLVERDDGPMVIRLEVPHEGTPKLLHYYSL